MNGRKIIYMLQFLFLFLSLNAAAKTNDRYKSNLDLLKKEKNKLRSDAIYYSIMPFPLPVLVNVYKGTLYWNKFNKCNEIYKYYKSAHILVESEQGDSSYSKKVKQKSYNRLYSLLLEVQKETRTAKVNTSGIVAEDESQLLLNETIENMNVMDLAHLLERANLTIPPTCGKAESGFVNYDAYNLRFRIRRSSIYSEGKSILEAELDKEEAALFEMKDESNKNSVKELESASNNNPEDILTD